jgi:multicomponent K+:H+ antiporter subunit C
MEALVAIGVGVLTAAGVFLLLRPRTFDVIVGLTLISYAVNLFLFSMGRLTTGRAPIIRTELAPTLESYADPLPQALVLTAIVIGFAMTALIVVIAIASYAASRTDHVDPPVSAEDRERGP